MKRFRHGVAVSVGTAVTVAGLLAGGAIPAGAQTSAPAAADGARAVTGTSAAAVTSAAHGAAAVTAAVTGSQAVAAITTAYSAPARTLRYGMRGSDVRALQQRLAALKYYPGPADGIFGNYTLEAVWAFQEVQKIGVDGIVGPVTGRSLVHPHAYQARYPKGGSLRVEINLGTRVLVLYRSNKIALISHVSTGGGYLYRSGNGWARAVTPTGKFRTTVYLPGWITVPLGTMYNSVFFIGTVYAIHGATSVPLNPVSHGCVRMPMDIAAFFHTLVKTPGTPVYIYK